MRIRNSTICDAVIMHDTYLLHGWPEIRRGRGVRGVVPVYNPTHAATTQRAEHSVVAFYAGVAWMLGGAALSHLSSGSFVQRPLEGVGTYTVFGVATHPVGGHFFISNIGGDSPWSSTAGGLCVHPIGDDGVPSRDAIFRQPNVHVAALQCNGSQVVTLCDVKTAQSASRLCPDGPHVLVWKLDVQGAASDSQASLTLQCAVPLHGRPPRGLLAVDTCAQLVLCGACQQRELILFHTDQQSEPFKWDPFAQPSSQDSPEHLSIARGCALTAARYRNVRVWQVIQDVDKSVCAVKPLFEVTNTTIMYGACMLSPGLVVLIHGSFNQDCLFEAHVAPNPVELVREADSSTCSQSEPRTTWPVASLVRSEGAPALVCGSNSHSGGSGASTIVASGDGSTIFLGGCNGRIYAFNTSTWAMMGSLRYPWHISKWNHVDTRVVSLAAVPDSCGIRFYAAYERYGGVCFDLSLDSIPDRAPSDKSLEVTDATAYAYMTMHETETCDEVTTWEGVSYQFVIVPITIAPGWDDASFACNWVGAHGFRRHMESCYAYRPHDEETVGAPKEPEYRWGDVPDDDQNASQLLDTQQKWAAWAVYCARLGVRRLQQLGCTRCPALADEHIEDRGVPQVAAHPTLRLCPRTLASYQRLSYGKLIMAQDQSECIIGATAAVSSLLSAVSGVEFAVLLNIGTGLHAGSHGVQAHLVASEDVVTRRLQEMPDIADAEVQNQHEFALWMKKTC